MAQGNVIVDLSRVEKRLDRLTDLTNSLKGDINFVSSELKKTNSELEDLRRQFIQMIEEQRNQAALQQASTELVRVRQELERDYGNYKVIRETMLGVLQATDLALVKKATISRVSEELMLATPNYWLAPCLIAVSAWIANDRELADRAIAEAMKRDPEKTAITMALICRRNNRVQTCYEWLSIYFSYQNSAEFSENSFAYVDAYVNGVFGPDENHMCDDYIVKWMNEIKRNSSNLEQEQTDIWNNYCKGFSVDIKSLYPELSVTAKEYPDIDAYVGRILASDYISGNFKKINDADVSQETLKARIDSSLIRLISRYNDDEEPLRKEEEYLKAIKFFDGDKEKARQTIVAAEQKRRDNTYTLVDRMTNVITTADDVLPSERKTAVSFLSGYIRKGYDQFVTEKKEKFPKTVNLQIDDWNGVSEDGTNIDELQDSYKKHLSIKHDLEIAKAKRNGADIMKYISFGLLILGAILLIFSTPLSVFFLAVGAGLFAYSIITRNKTADKIDKIESDYILRERQGLETIQKAARQWSNAKHLVYEFENGEKKEIVA